MGIYIHTLKSKQTIDVESYSGFDFKLCLAPYTAKTSRRYDYWNLMEEEFEIFDERKRERNFWESTKKMAYELNNHEVHKFKDYLGLYDDYEFEVFNFQKAMYKKAVKNGELLKGVELVCFTRENETMSDFKKKVKRGDGDTYVYMRNDDDIIWWDTPDYTPEGAVGKLVYLSMEKKFLILPLEKDEKHLEKYNLLINRKKEELQKV